MKLSGIRSSAGWTIGGLGVLGAGYVTLAAAAWARFGHAKPPCADEADELLERFIPAYEVVERHQLRVAAPAAVTLAAAKHARLDASLIVRSIFKGRELLLGADPPPIAPPEGLLASTTAIGWRVLAEVPDREVVVGAVTQPWMPNVVFRGIEPGEFRTFQEPGYAKIVWTLRADPVDDTSCIFRTETRVTTTDADARRRFRWYWARFSPGIAVIRLAMVRSLKREAERLAPGAVS